MCPPLLCFLMLKSYLHNKGSFSLELSVKTTAHFWVFVKYFFEKIKKIFQKNMSFRGGDAKKVNVTEIRSEIKILGMKRVGKIKAREFPRAHKYQMG